MAQEEGWTSGPWHVEPRDKRDGAWGQFRDREIVAQDGHVIADLRCNGRNEGPRGEANADLLAAAPELYEALKLFSNLGDASVRADVRNALRAHERDTFDRMIALARSALSKACGVQAVTTDEEYAASLPKHLQSPAA